MDSAVTVAEYFSVTLVSVFLGWFLYRWILFNLRSFPRGPIGLPLMGYMGMSKGEKPEKHFLELSKIYGKVFSLYIGPAYTVVVNDYAIAKEIVSHTAALSRPDGVFDFIPEKGGFAGINGAEWQEQRRFCVTTMRNLGLGRGPWETLIKEHVVDFIDEISSWNGKPSDISEPLLVSISSNNTALLMGRRLSGNYEIQLAKKAEIILADHFCPTSLTVLVPWLAKYLVWFRIGEYHKRRVLLNEFANMFRAEIEKHLKSEGEQSEDFIGCYLQEMEKQNASNKQHHFSVDNLVGHLVVLFFGGGDTTVSSMHWILLLMASYPEVQKKVHEELDEVLGGEGKASWDERKRLPYTMATILEMERYVTINRVFVPRIASRTFECSGYKIPRGSRILVNSWAVMHDPKYFDKPLEFMPERFIQSDGTKSAGLSVFSFGRRNCPGETVAMMTIFLYFTTVMKKFRITTPSGGMADLSDGSHGVVVSPAAQGLCFTER